jgi:hypothetical protein
MGVGADLSPEELFALGERNGDIINDAKLNW